MLPLLYVKSRTVVVNMMKSSRVWGVLAVLLTCAVGAWTWASVVGQPEGQLDSSFSGDGKVTTPIRSNPDHEDYGQATAIQSNGKIVVAGYSFNGNDTDFALARYNSDGTLDTSFDSDGKVTTDFGSSDDFCGAIAIQSDGKIVVAGHSNDGTGWDFALARYNSNGTLDTSFDGDGTVITPIGTGNDFDGAIAIQGDGKIVAAGYSNDDFALARYNSDGSFDSNFGSGGKVITPIGSGGDYVHALAIQSNGKLVAAGSSYNGSNYDFALVRYNSDGSVDTNFGSGGKVITSFGSDGDYAYAVVIQSDGKIVAAGDSELSLPASSYPDFALARYNSDGSLDTSFGSGGKVTTSNGAVGGAALQSDGKIVVVGAIFNGSNNDFALARYNSNGSLDTSFGSGGKVTTPIGGSNDVGRATAIQRDGRIVVAGYSNNGTNNDFALARYYGTGSSLSVSDVEVTESDTTGTNAVFTVRLSAPSTQSVTVNYTTERITALPGEDYVERVGVLTFDPGQTSKLISVPIIGDTNVEPTEIFYLQLSSPINAIISDGQGQGTIISDEVGVSGGKIAFASDRDGNSEIYIMNADGTNQTRLTNNSANNYTPALSPDGSKIAWVSHRDGNNEIYAMTANGNNQVNLTNNPAQDYNPSWSPDGSRIAFNSDRNGEFEIFVMNASGSNQILLPNNTGETDAFCPSWSPDGSRIAFDTRTAGYYKIYMMNADGSNQTRLTNESYNPVDKGAYEQSWSPDASRLAFTIDPTQPNLASDIFTMRARDGGDW